MKKIFIFPNLTEERYIEKVRKAIACLEQKGHICVLNKDDGFLLYGMDYQEKGKIEDCEFIVALGGDGTFLRGCQLALKYDMPICGINCGNVGFLCACQLKEIDELDLDVLLEKKLSLLDFDYEGRTHTVLNEVVIGKDYFGGTIELEYDCQNHKERFRGDGLIICTATGSTAYNTSAGGMTFKEEDDLIGITPICPHTKNIHALTVDEKLSVMISLINRKYTASIFADGILIGKLEKITVRLSDRKIRVLSRH